MRSIADTGLLLGALARNDPYHRHAREAFRQHAPWHTCDAVLVELTVDERDFRIYRRNGRESVPFVALRRG